ncbi:MAG: hypothetical protein RIQ59_475 [Bacteroidota bacterium]|jgi:hypothetical protein
MKKQSILIFVFISALGFSQQVLMKRNFTQFSFLCLANGNSLATVCGNNNFSESYSNYSIAIQYQTITMGLSTSTSVNIANENSNYVNFNWLNPGIEYTSTAITNPNPLSFLIKSVWADCNNDNSKDALYVSIDFPITQTNGASIPVGTKIIFSSPVLNDSISGGQLLDSIQRWFEWDGEGWSQSSLFGSYPIVNENWQSNFLSIDELSSENAVLLYPNPSNNTITIQNKANTTEDLKYKIIDSSGRIWNCGNSKFNELLNIDFLSSGNYIIKIETENGKSLVVKLIKN